jgi:NAD(P)-dependent dehydrogenase (short-subunit alcohol dehydrogenase family)
MATLDAEPRGSDTRPVAWVTGASRGMGADTAVALAGAGFDVALTARDTTRLEAVATRVEAVGGAALPMASDLTDRASIEGFADAATERFGRCDVLCNIGIYQGQGGMKELFMDTPIEEVAVSLEADVVAPALLCQRAIAMMLTRGGGTILNMSSASVVMEPPGTVEDNGWTLAYVAAKAGIDQFASVLNVELGEQGIRAFTVEPGFVAYGEKLADALRKYPGMPVSPPESIGPAMVWLVTSPEADRLRSKRVNLPGLCHKQRLLERWDGPGTLYPAP